MNKSALGIHVYASVRWQQPAHNQFSCFLTGDIIFNAQYPELPPDFIFGEDAEFLPEPSELPVSILSHGYIVFCSD